MRLIRVSGMRRQTGEIVAVALSQPEKALEAKDPRERPWRVPDRLLDPPPQLPLRDEQRLAKLEDACARVGELSHRGSDERIGRRDVGDGGCEQAQPILRARRARHAL